MNTMAKTLEVWACDDCGHVQSGQAVSLLYAWAVPPRGSKTKTSRYAPVLDYAPGFEDPDICERCGEYYGAFTCIKEVRVAPYELAGRVIA